MDGQQKHDVTAQSIEANAKIMEKTGEEAAVLLKNEGGALPLESRRPRFRGSDRPHRRPG